MAAEGVWHGTKKCAVNRAKLPRANQVPGQRCPFCGNTVGAYIGASRTPAASSAKQQLANLQRLLDDGLITDEEYAERRETLLDEAVAAPTPQPRQVLRPPAASSSTQFGKSLYDDRRPTDTKRPSTLGTDRLRLPSAKIIAWAVMGLIAVAVVVGSLSQVFGGSLSLVTTVARRAVATDSRPPSRQPSTESSRSRTAMPCSGSSISLTTTEASH